MLKSFKLEQYCQVVEEERGGEGQINKKGGEIREPCRQFFGHFCMLLKLRQ